MKTQIQNVLYGVLDYVAYPVIMLIVSPFLMKSLGVEGYGVWSVMAAVISTMSIVVSGFGDAAIKQISQYRANDSEMVRATVSVMLAVTGVLALVLAIPIAAASPLITEHLVRGNTTLRLDCIVSLVIASVLVVQRSVESVFIATQRAFERYGAAVRISAATRVTALISGTLAAYCLHRVWSVLLVAAVCNIAGTALQHRRVSLVLGTQLLPGWHPLAAAELFTFGKHSWLLALSGVVFGQLDRIVLGIWLGASSTAAYAVCTQIAQPIYGISAAGLHALFPYLAHRVGSGSHAGWHRAIALATVSNIGFVVTCSFALQSVGEGYLHVFRQVGMPGDSQRLLVTLLWASALLSLSVVPTYALYALNRVHLVTLFNVFGAILCIVCMVMMGKRWGSEGIALARIAYGCVGLLLYLPLWRAMNRSTNQMPLLQLLRGDA